jgi:hypothetical protein
MKFEFRGDDLYVEGMKHPMESRIGEMRSDHQGTTWVIEGRRPQADRDAEKLTERFGIRTEVAPDTGYGTTADLVMVEKDGVRSMDCPVCGNPVENASSEIGETFRYAEDPADKQLAAMGYQGHLPSERRMVVNYRFTFQPCGDTFIADVLNQRQSIPA